MIERIGCRLSLELVVALATLSLFGPPRLQLCAAAVAAKLWRSPGPAAGFGPPRNRAGHSGGGGTARGLTSPARE